MQPVFNKVAFVYDSPIQGPHFFRGRGRGQVRGRGRGSPFANSRGRGLPQPRYVSDIPGASDTLPTGRGILDGLSPQPVKKICLDRFPSIRDPIEITNPETIGSYNWLDEPSSTILVPGSPSEWKEKPFPYAVLPDKGLLVQNHDGCRLPSSPLLPLMVAVEELQDKPYPWHTIDIMTDRSNLRKLFRWVHRNGPHPPTFRIDLHFAGDRTILMKRWEKRDQEEATGFSFGMNFRNEATRLPSICKGSLGHQHIVRYNMNGLSMIVRFGVDACLPSESVESPEPNPLQTTYKEHKSHSAQPANKFGLLAQDAQPQRNFKDELDVRRGGDLVPFSSLVEITTRSEARKGFYDWNEGYPQLYLSQTMHHYLAINHRGTFHSLETRRLDSPEMEQIHGTFQSRFKAFYSLLQFIRDLVLKYGENCDLSLVCQNGQLCVYERLNRGSCLPEDYMARFKSPGDDLL